jgi:hypothetical protein
MNSTARKPCPFHDRAGALDVMFAQPVSINVLLPINSSNTEISNARGLPPSSAQEAPVPLSN